MVILVAKIITTAMTDNDDSGDDADRGGAAATGGAASVHEGNKSMTINNLDKVFSRESCFKSRKKKSCPPRFPQTRCSPRKP